MRWVAARWPGRSRRRRCGWTLPACPQGLRDSKVMSAAARERLFDWLMEHAKVSVAHASVEEIDRLNILRASHLAMERAVAAPARRPCA